MSNESFQQKSITLFPIPVSNNLNILFENNFENASVKIISITGQVVKENKAISGDTISLDVSELSKGIYIIQILNNNSLLTSKFIKE